MTPSEDHTKLPPETAINVPTGPVVRYQALRSADGQLIDFRLVLLTDAARQLWQHPQVDLTGLLLSELYIHHDAQFLIRQFALVADSGRSVRIDETFRWLQGEEAPHGALLISAWDDGVWVRYGPDTDRLIAEKKIKQAEFNLTILDSVQTAVSAYDAVRDERGQLIDFRITLVNAVLLVQAGRSEAEVVGCLLTETFPGAIPTGVLTRCIAVVETGQNQQYELHYDHDGLDVWVLGAISPFGDGVVIASTDITQQRRAEQEKQQLAEFNRTVLDTITTAVAAYDAVRDAGGQLIDFRFTLVNQAFVKQVGRPEAELVGCLLTDAFPGTLQSGTFDQYLLSLETGQLQRREAHYTHDGLDIWVASSIMPYGDGVVASWVDITQRKQAEIAMREQQQQLEIVNFDLKRSNESLDSFAYIASHDLQEPLRKMTSFTDILHHQYAGQFDANATDILRRINASAERMKLLIQDLLAYSRIDAKLAAFKPIDLAKLIHDLQEEDLWASLRQHKGTINLNGLPTLTADPLLMRQLFQNLLTNALKFCRSGIAPVVTVSSRVINRADLPADLPIANLPDVNPAFHEIAVADNGIGFDPKYVDRIFQVFQRLHGRTQYPGSGIGLSICQKIVERHGGAITARSVPGEGSTFLVYWPVALVVSR